jgi:molybdate transport system ATP-binding protein
LKDTVGFELTHLDSAAGPFVVTGGKLSLGSAVRLPIVARDVSLTLARQSDTSILNIESATVDEMPPDGDAQMIVRLNLGSVPLLSRIIRKSGVELGLNPGKSVFPQVETIALLT